MDEDEVPIDSKKRKWRTISESEWEVKKRLEMRRTVRTWLTGVRDALAQRDQKKEEEDALETIIDEVEQEEADFDCTTRKVVIDAIAQAEADAYARVARHVCEGLLEDVCQEMSEMVARSEWQNPRGWLTDALGGSASNASPMGVAQRQRCDLLIWNGEDFEPFRNPNANPHGLTLPSKPDTYGVKQENKCHCVQNVDIESTCAVCHEDKVRRTKTLTTYMCMNPKCVCVYNVCDTCKQKIRVKGSHVLEPADDDVRTEASHNKFGARVIECRHCRQMTSHMIPDDHSVLNILLKVLQTPDGLRIGFRCHTCNQYDRRGRIALATNSDHACGSIHIVCGKCCSEKYADDVTNISCGVSGCNRTLRFTGVTFDTGILRGGSFNNTEMFRIAEPDGNAAGPP